MAQSSWPSPDTSRVVNDQQYERLAISYGAYSGQVGVPGATQLCFGDSTGLQVKIKADRYAHVRGYEWYSGASDFTKSISANSSGSTRIDLVVLRLTRSTWNVTAEVVNGTPGSGTAPAATQSSGPSTGVWELPIATVTVVNGASGINAADVTAIPIHTATDGSGLLTYAATTGVFATVQSWIPSPFPGMKLYNAFDGAQAVYTGSAWRLMAPDVQLFTATGTWTKPTGAVWVKICGRAAGGGGGGAQTAATNEHSQGGGGGEGGYCEVFAAANALGSTLAVTIGAGGAGGAANAAGSNGNDTTVGSILTAKAGLGGERCSSSAVAFGCAGGAGGPTAGATGDIKIAGAPGGHGFGSGSLNISGQGGGAGGGKGAAAPAAAQSIAGTAGTLGGGGGGALTSSTGAGQSGGAGGGGWVTITTYFS